MANWAADTPLRHLLDWMLGLCHAGLYGHELAEDPEQSLREAVVHLNRALVSGDHELPTVGLKVRLRRGLLGGRLVIETATRPEVIGLVPTRYNYLLACQGAGFSYPGAVTAADAASVPHVEVQLAAVAP